MAENLSSLARSRIEKLLDSRSFVEIGAYITARNTDFNMPAKQIPSDGVITGYGTIDGSLVYVYSQDAQILGGSIGEMHAGKIADIYTLAMKTGAPVIGLLDCVGFRLQESTDTLAAFGKIYLSQNRASGVIPQIQAIFGSCGGGMAISSSLGDFTFMENTKARLFINSPNTIQKNHEGKCDTSGAEFQNKKAGNVDAIGSEDEILGQIRTLIGILPANYEDDFSYGECRDDLNRMTESLSAYRYDTGLLLSEISDEHFYMELKKDYAPEMVTAFIRLNGNTVGCIANRSRILGEEGEKTEEFEKLLTDKGCSKAADFIDFCDRFNIPLLSIVAAKGFAATCCTEKRLARSGARLVNAFAEAEVPKVSLIVGEAFGSAYVCMNSKSIGADLVYAWEDAAIGMMDAEEAVKIIYQEEIESSDDKAGFLSEKTKQYHDLQSSAMVAARRGYVDDIITPAETRKKLIAAFEMLFTKKEFRMIKRHRNF